MICSACLRRRAFAGGIAARPTSSLLQAPKKRALSAASRRLSVPPVITSSTPSPRPLRPPPSIRSRLFSSSPTTSSVAAQPQETSPVAGAPEKPSYLSEGESQVWDRLVAELAPAELVVQDISGGCGSMYGIEISSDKFRGLPMLKQQRLVNAALGDLMKDWHGVQLKTRVP